MSEYEKVVILLSQFQASLKQLRLSLAETIAVLRVTEDNISTILQGANTDAN